MKWLTVILAVLGSLACGGWLAAWAKPGEGLFGFPGRKALLGLAFVAAVLVVSAAAVGAMRPEPQEAQQPVAPAETTPSGEASRPGTEESGAETVVVRYVLKDDLSALPDWLPADIEGFRLTGTDIAVRSISGHEVEEARGTYLPAGYAGPVKALLVVLARSKFTFTGERAQRLHGLDSDRALEETNPDVGAAGSSIGSYYKEQFTENWRSFLPAEIAKMIELGEITSSTQTGFCPGVAQVVSGSKLDENTGQYLHYYTRSFLVVECITFYNNAAANAKDEANRVREKAVQAVRKQLREGPRP